MNAVNLKDVLFANSSEYYQDGFQQGVKYVALPLPSNNTSLLVASNIVSGMLMKLLS